MRFSRAASSSSPERVLAFGVVLLVLLFGVDSPGLSGLLAAARARAEEAARVDMVLFDRGDTNYRLLEGRSIKL